MNNQQKQMKVPLTNFERMPLELRIFLRLLKKKIHPQSSNLAKLSTMIVLVP